MSFFDLLSNRLHIANIIRWLVRGVVAGCCIAVAMWALVNSIAWVSLFRNDHPFMLLLLPVAAVLTALLYRRTGHSVEQGTGLAIDAINEDILRAINPSQVQAGKSRPTVPVRLAPLVFASSIISHAVGASAGKEGAGVQIGASIASGLARFEAHIEKLLGLHKDSAVDRTEVTALWLICGAGAAFGALFHAPMAGTVFGMQVSSPRINRLEALAPCLAASYASSALSGAMGIHYTVFPRVTGMPYTLESILQLSLFGIACAVASRAFFGCIRFVKRVSSCIKIDALRVFATSVLLLIVSIGTQALFSETPFNGLGMSLVLNALQGQDAWYIPVGKLLFTALTLAAGLKGGEFVPSMVFGATFGAAMSPVFGLPVDAMVVYGIAGVLSGATKLPVVCFLLVLELFGMGTSPSLVFLVCCIGFIGSGNNGMYERQIL